LTKIADWDGGSECPRFFLDIHRASRRATEVRVSSVFETLDPG